MDLNIFDMFQSIAVIFVLKLSQFCLFSDTVISSIGMETWKTDGGGQ